MKFVSTRGDAPVLNFCDTMLAGLARDGGLYVPDAWPQITASQIHDMAGSSYANIAKVVLAPFVAGEIATSDMNRLIDEAYASFHHPVVTPLVQTGANEWVLELFHGPTMAFKDVAMQLLGPMMDHVLTSRGERVTIVGATSGDTGGAAIEAFRGRQNVDIFILFPHGRVSPVQQRQMTTVDDANVHALAVRGDFDDCQALLKALFNDLKFRDRMNLSAVNSINWARIMAQIVYYFVAASALGSPDRKVSFCVPSGNFGDIFAGYVARQMGLPIDQLIIATNTNDILARTLETGRYEVTGVTATSSPSMDIQISSNFERLLFEVMDRGSGAVRGCMASLSQSGAFQLPENALARIKAEFTAGRCDEAQCQQTIKSMYEDIGYMLDPHSAVGLAVARQKMIAGSAMITLATAHPAKFPQAIKQATGVDIPLPQWQSDLMARKERFMVIDNDLDALKKYVEAHTRV